MGRRGKPTLPKSVDWPKETAKWFDEWRDSPRTDGWSKQQWSYLLDTALVHAEVWGSFNTSMLPELHRREAYMGVSFDQRKSPARSGKPTVLQMVISDRAAKERAAANGG